MKTIIVLLLTLKIIPFLLSLILIEPGKIEGKARKALSVAGALLADGLSMYLIDVAVFGGPDFPLQIRRLLSLDGYYQDIPPLVRGFLFSVAASTGIAIVIRLLNDRKHALRISKASLGLSALLFAAAFFILIPAEYRATEGRKSLRIVEVCRRTTEPTSALQALGGIEINVSYYVVQNTGELGNRSTVYLSLDPEATERIAMKVDLPAGETAKQLCLPRDGLNLRKKGGSTVYLTDDMEDVVDSVTVPALRKNEACALKSGEWVAYWVIPPEPEPVFVPLPEFSSPGGFYKTDFMLTLSAPNNGRIYYTVDGSIPTADSTPYEAPVRVYDRSKEPNRYRSVQNVRKEYLDRDEIGSKPVDKAFVVRAIAVDEDGNASNVRTETYFVGLEKYRDRKVVSLVADPEDLFGQKGIMVTGPEYDAWYAKKRSGELSESDKEPKTNFSMRGDKWERKANFEFFREGEPTVNQAVGIKLQGQTARSMALKRFTVVARKQYSGSKLFDAELFDSRQTHSVVLRSGFINAFSMELCKDRNVATQSSQPVSVFLDGEFWYDTYMVEKYNNTFISQAYGVDSKNVTVLRIGGKMEEADKALYAEITGFPEQHDLSVPENYEAFGTVIDMQSYIDFLCINAYLGNHDRTDNHNIMAWRTNLNEGTPQGDTRWRFGLYDMDLELASVKKDTGAKTSSQVNSFTAYKEGFPHRQYNSQPLYVALRSNDEFRKQYVLTFMDLVNTTFSVPVVEENLERWGSDLSYDDYFFRDRPEYITQYMAKEFGLTGTQEEIRISGGEGCRVSINTADDLALPWQGKYYTDYPVTLSASPESGYEFLGWEIDGRLITDRSLEISLREGGIDVNVRSRKIPSQS